MIGFLRSAWLLARKDLRMFFRDRTGMLLGFLLPVALVTVFGFVMKSIMGADGDEAMPRVRLWVADLDGSEESRGLVAALRVASTVSLQPEAEQEGLEPESLEEAQEWVAEGKNNAHHVLVIPQGYGADVAAGSVPRLEIARDPGRPMESRLVSIGVMQAFMQQTEGRLWPALMGRSMEGAGMDPASAQTLVGFMESARQLMAGVFAAADEPAGADAGGSPRAAPDLTDFTAWMSPATFVDVQRGDRPSTLTLQLAQVVAGMTVMMLMFGLMAVASTLIEEREKGTLRRLFLAPLERESILFSKFLLAAVIGAMQLVVLLTYGELVFRVNMFRDPVTLAILMLSTVAAVTSFGMLVASWARTQKQAEGLSTLLILVMSALGGAWFPVQYFEGSLPAVARVAMRCTLTHWSMSGFQGMLWYERPWTDSATLAALGVLWSFALAAGAMSWMLFRRRHLSR
ncbi:MAG: ABC transporter permease [Planctomycetota bacterium]|nr:MAG: ABC transporter permease [Planctomycetota bacterium]